MTQIWSDDKKYQSEYKEYSYTHYSIVQKILKDTAWKHKEENKFKKKKKEVRWTFSNLVIRLQSHTCKSYKLKDLAMYAHNSNPLVMTRVISCTKSIHYRSEPTSKSCFVISLQSQFLQIGKLNENKIRTNLNKRAFSKICHWLGAFR